MKALAIIIFILTTLPGWSQQKKPATFHVQTIKELHFHVIIKSGRCTSMNTIEKADSIFVRGDIKPRQPLLIIIKKRIPRSGARLTEPILLM